MRLLIRLLLACLLLPIQAYAAPCADWPMWRTFEQRFIQADGRVLADESERHYSTSEGQAYALFFSLVANDRTAFERILVWTRDNLAGGDLSARLPAWQWGKRPDGAWGVADQNSASDADTWLAYTLLEAGRLWHEPRYTAQGKLMLANVHLHLVRDFSGLGAMLMPAASGFDLVEGGARFNPSYYPVQLLRVFAKADPAAGWDEIIDNSYKLIQAASSKGYAPDWQGYVPGTGFVPDPKSGDTGAHDAIRVYLWWGMLDRHDPMAARLKSLLYGMNQWVPRHEITPPLSVDARTGVVSGVSPPSFSAALLPYFSTMGNKRALELQKDRLLAYQVDGLIGQDPRYYDQVLTLFGQGWLAHNFSFSSQGQLVVQWNSSCSAIK
jgi:endoglucanase